MTKIWDAPTRGRRWLGVAVAAWLAVFNFVATTALASHGGSIPVYGDQDDDCRLIDMLYADGHTDHFYACGSLATNDLTPAEIPQMHVTELHTSCSDSFEDTDGDGEGEFQKGDPTGATHAGTHTVARYRIVHFDAPADPSTPIEDRDIDKECGETFTQTTPIGICVDLVNDASGDGTFTDDELAEAEGLDVPEQLTVTNCADHPIVVDSVTVTTESGTALDVCDDLLGTTMDPGASELCELVQPAHSPPDGQTLTDTATVVGHQPLMPENTATDQDPTAMRTVVPPSEPPPSPSPSPTPTPDVDVCVDLVNDASGDGAYTDDELASADGLDVPEQLTVTNCGDEPAVIDEVTVDTDGNDPIDVCDELLGMTLEPGASELCEFVQLDHSPPAGTNRTDTATVVVHHPDDASLTATDQDPTQMRTAASPPPAAPGSQVGDTGVDNEPDTDPSATAPDSLARTGPDDAPLLGTSAASLIAVGALLLLFAARVTRRNEWVIARGHGEPLDVGQLLMRQLRWARQDLQRYAQRDTSIGARLVRRLLAMHTRS